MVLGGELCTRGALVQYLDSYVLLSGERGAHR
jgi:hypothetical protein